jgi:hypothetical protein
VKGKGYSYQNFVVVYGFYFIWSIPFYHFLSIGLSYKTSHSANGYKRAGSEVVIDTGEIK